MCDPRRPARVVLVLRRVAHRRPLHYHALASRIGLWKPIEAGLCSENRIDLYLDEVPLRFSLQPSCLSFAPGDLYLAETLIAPLLASPVHEPPSYNFEDLFLLLCPNPSAP